MAGSVQSKRTGKMAGYESEITRFLRDLKQQKPDIERKQREGRAIWWDKMPDPDESQRREESNVPQPAYVYFPPPRVKPPAAS
jgi:hypothetical protein